MSKGSVNKSIIVGTLGRDPEMRYLPNGNAVCSVSLATDEGYKDKQTGQWVDKTEWHRIESFGKLAEIMGEYLKKGAKCYVEGKLRTDEYEKDGIKRYSTKIIASEMTMLDSKPSGVDQSQQYAQQAPMQQAPQQPAYNPQQVPQQAPANFQQPAYHQAPNQIPNNGDVPF